MTSWHKVSIGPPKQKKDQWNWIPIARWSKTDCITISATTYPHSCNFGRSPNILYIREYQNHHLDKTGNYFFPFTYLVTYWISFQSFVETYGVIVVVAWHGQNKATIGKSRWIRESNLPGYSDIGHDLVSIKLFSIFFKVLRILNYV